MNIYLNHNYNYLACQSAFSYTQQLPFNGEKWKLLMRSGTSIFMVRFESHFTYLCRLSLLRLASYQFIILSYAYLNLIFSWVHDNDEFEWLLKWIVCPAVKLFFRHMFYHNVYVLIKYQREFPHTTQEANS